LSIVRTLVTTELDGTIVMRTGSQADFDSPGLSDDRLGDGTVVELRLPRPT
jgi:hypothetical protein